MSVSWIPMKQSATWKRTTGYNQYGEPTTSATTISCRWAGKRRMVRDIHGETVVSDATMNCADAIAVGDILTYDGRDWPVINVMETPDLNGVVHFREVFL